MIQSTMTLSRADAEKAFAFDPDYASELGAPDRVAWVAIDDGDSPFHNGNRGANVLRMQFADWDKMSPWRGHWNPGNSSVEPTLEHATEIVRHLLALHDDPKPVTLLVHCGFGLYRSGAIVEWLRLDLGISESKLSRRLVDLIDDGRARSDMRPYNWTLLHLLRRAAAMQGCRATQCSSCGGNALTMIDERGVDVQLPHGEPTCEHVFGELRADEPDEYPKFFREIS